MTTTLQPNITAVLKFDKSEFETTIQIEKNGKRAGFNLTNLTPANKKFVINIQGFGKEDVVIIGCEKGYLVVTEADKHEETTRNTDIPSGEKYFFNTRNTVLVNFLAISEETDLPVKVCLEIKRNGNELSVSRL